MSDADDPYAALSRLIAARILGVRTDEQDIELDDADWRLIIDALSHKALTRAEMNERTSCTAPNLMSK